MLNFSSVMKNDKKQNQRASESNTGRFRKNTNYKQKNLLFQEYFF